VAPGYVMGRFRVAVTHGFTNPVTGNTLSPKQAAVSVLDSGDCFRNCGEFTSETYARESSRGRIGIEGAIAQAQALADRLESEYA
jgi:hypothetical protein